MNKVKHLFLLSGNFFPKKPEKVMPDLYENLGSALQWFVMHLVGN
jgi:hypothetical protein